MNYLIALVAGALLPLSLAPFGLWPLGILSIGAWFWSMRRAGSRDWLLGWLFGVGKYAAGASWIYVSINVYGHAPPLLAGFLVVLFVAGMALFTVINAWVFARLRTGHVLADAATFAVVFVFAEWLLTWLLTGFPWLFAGHAHLDTPLAGLAPVGGVLLVSLAVALTATMPVAAWVLWRSGAGSAGAAPGGPARSLAAVALGIALLPWLAGLGIARVDWVQPGATLEVAMVQGNVDQSVKWDPQESDRITRTYLDLTEPLWDAGLVIWPEAALTRFEHEIPGLLGELHARGAAAGTTLILGLPYAERRADGSIAYYNAVRAVGAGDGRYLKRRLVPFGEYVPLEAWLRGLIAFFDLPMSGFSRGPDAQPLLEFGGRRAVMAICYEVVYPELLRTQAAEADVLMTVSNDTWFGASTGPLQHLEMAQMRALENGRWMLRATNNGVTAIIDARGRIRDRLPQFEAGVLRGRWQVMTGATPYARYGYLPLLGCALVLGVFAAFVRRRGALGRR
jgi:apolipoprotein N-acyltransferase